MDERLGQANPLEHAFGKALQALVAMRGEPDQIYKIRDALAQSRRLHAAEPAMKLQKLGCRQPLIKTEIFGQESDFASDFDLARWRSENEGFTATGADQAEQHFYGCALAGSVGTEEAKDFAARNIQRQVLDGDLIAKHLAQISRFDGKAA
jgi:hypothetical protein